MIPFCFIILLDPYWLSCKPGHDILVYLETNMGTVVPRQVDFWGYFFILKDYRKKMSQGNIHFLKCSSFVT